MQPLPTEIGAPQHKVGARGGLPHASLQERAEPLTVTIGRTAATAITGVVSSLRQALDRAARVGPIDVDAVLASVVSDVYDCIGQLLLPTFLLELNVARLRGRLHGDTSEARFRDFLDSMNDGGTLQLLREYSQLAALIAEVGTRRADALSECVMHFAEDADDLHASLLLQRSEHALVAIGRPCGDPHHRSRTVRILQLRSGESVVYKPRSLTTDIQFQRALQCLNERGARIPFPILRVITRPTHGWQEYVSYKPCSSTAEIERFYARQGGYLALLWLFNGSDMHYGNIIACGEYPYLVDLETVGQPRQRRPNGTTPNEFSVLDVGYLPTRWRTTSNNIVDVSGLTARQASATETLPILDVGHDTMRVRAVSPHVGPVQSSPGMDPDAHAEHHIDGIAEGFSDTYSQLESARHLMLREGHPLHLNIDKVRVIPRSTRFYLQAASTLVHPDSLRDVASFERCLSVLSTPAGSASDFATLVKAEKDDLRACDVPHFVTTPRSRSLFAGDGTEHPGCLLQSSQTCFAENVGRLSAAHHRQQVWLIRTALQTLRPDTPRTRGALRAPAPVADRQALRASVAAAAEAVMAMACGDNKRAWWYTLEPRGKDWCVCDAGVGLYDGAAGIALFLAYAGRYLERRDLLLKARAALRTVTCALDTDPPQRALGLSGVGGLVYALTHLACVLDNRKAARLALNLIRDSTERAIHEVSHDLIDGTAGWIKTALAFHLTWREADMLNTLTAAGETLARRARHEYGEGHAADAPAASAALTGFAHGASGVADTLGSLSMASSTDRFRADAMACLDFERRHFDCAARNWPTLRQGPSFASDPMVAWCYGAPGIGLARLTVHKAFGDRQALEEMSLATETTLRSGFGGNHSLCHGDAGNIDCLLTIATQSRNAALRTEVDVLAATMCDAIRRRAVRCGHHAPGNAETYGLMTGISGIGLAMLRLLEPATPSILALEAPPASVPPPRIRT